MKTFSLVRYAFGLAAGVALLAGCGSAGTSPSLGSSSVVPPSARVSQASRIFAMTNVMHQGLPTVRGHVAHSWMKRVPKGTMLLYASDDSYLTVDVYDYPSGTLVGQATGFADPYGLCSDKKGNVYLADYGGKAYEIQHNTTKVINSWTVGGAPIGCSVSEKGDLAVSSFYPGFVEVFPGGGQSGKTYSGPAYDWAPGYDAKGNLFVECAYASPCSSPSIFELPAGSSSFQQLTLSGAKIGFANAVALEGKYIGVGDQEPSSQYALGIYSTTLSGSTLTVKHTTIDTGIAGCSADAASWANLSKHPNGLQTKKVKDIVSGCNSTDVGTWAFPVGGAPKSVTPVTYDVSSAVTLVK